MNGANAHWLHKVISLITKKCLPKNSNSQPYELGTSDGNLFS